MAFAVGKIVGYEGQVIVLAGGGQFCNTGILGYDSFRAGLRVDGTGAAAVLRARRRLHRHLQPTGSPRASPPPSATRRRRTSPRAPTRGGRDGSRSTTRCASTAAASTCSATATPRASPSPSRTASSGRARSSGGPVDQTTLLSEGATKFARPGVTDEEQRRTSQLAITGLLAPTSSGGQVVTSVFPALDDPEVAVDVLRGDLGLDDGRGQSIFTVDRSRLDTGELTRVARENMRPGDEITLDDGTRVRFDGVRDWVSLQVSHDPAQVWVLVSAVFVLVGLMLSLAVRRRRFWVRLTPDAAGGTRVELGGLARTDRAGYGEEFDRLTAQVLCHAGIPGDGGPPVNDVVLAIYSDRLFMAAVGVYVLAMVLHAAEYATLRAARAPATEVRPADTPVTVAAAAGPDERAARPGMPPGPDSDESAVGRSLPDEGAARRETPPRTRADRFGGAAVNLVVLAALLQLGSIVCRGLATDRWPLGNMYEFTSAVCLAAVVTWLVVLRRLPALRAVALFVLLPVVVLLFLAGTVLYARAAPVVPALRSYWLVVHVTTITVVVRAAARPGRGEPALPAAPVRPGRRDLAERLPSAAALDRLAYRTTIVAFPLYTFGVIAGAIWAEAAWGRFWGWDPKETVAFIAWVVYAAYLHARATAGWRGGRAAWINVAGLAVVLFNLFFINMVVAGLHSYAGV